MALLSLVGLSLVGFSFHSTVMFQPMNGGQERSIYLKDKMFSTTGTELNTTVGISFEAGMTRNSDSVMWIS